MDIDWGAVLKWIMDVVWVGAIFVVGLWASKFLARMAQKGMEKSGVDVTLTRFVGNVIRWTVIILVGIACLGAFGIETTGFAAMVGAAGLAIGLAFQGTLSSVAAGVMLLVLRPFKVGDTITVAGHTGDVEELGLFTTVLRTPDNHAIIVPNSAVFGADMVNYSTNGHRRVSIDVGTDYGADLDECIKVLTAAAKTIEDVREDVEVALVGLGASSIDWQVRVYCKPEDYFAKCHQLAKAAKEHLDAAGIGIPFPQMDVHLDRLDGGEAAS